MMKKTVSWLLASILLIGCSETPEKTQEVEAKKIVSNFTVKENSKKDTHSRSNFEDVKTTHIHLDLNVDFNQKLISGVARHEINNIAKVDEIIFDSKKLRIDKITLGKEQETETTFELTDNDELLGEALKVKIEPSTKFVNIYYSTTGNTEALGWMAPEKTLGKKHPFLFTQGQAILTRTWIPCQDTPGNRITYSANIQVPKDLLAVMSSVNNPKEKNDTGLYSFNMDKPVPAYLIALAVGDIGFAPISERTGVYTEPGMLDKCKFELADMEKMVKTAEMLYGAYQWGRYDVIVLPPAFPFGGMENPVLTFATPTIIAGDRSLISLIAHELAHSWSGNLVTNATWNDFWLNEGFTVYFEERIMEEIVGKEKADMLSLIEYNNLLDEHKHITSSEHPEDACLKLHLENRSPDDGMTAIAYNKGALFLRTLEEKVGRSKFDAFLKKYFTEHAFQTLTTEDFLTYLDQELLIKEHISFNIDEWVYGNGIPSNAAKLTSQRYQKVDELVAEFTKEYNLELLPKKRTDWMYQEWSRFLNQLPDELPAEVMQKLDDKYQVKTWGNSEIMSEWFVLSIRHGYEGSFPEMKDFLFRIGRSKFLEPIYGELLASENETYNKMAYDLYNANKVYYHSVAIGWIDEIFAEAEKKKENS